MEKTSLALIALLGGGDSGGVLARNTTPDRDGWTFTAALSGSKNVAFLRWARAGARGRSRPVSA